LTNILNSTLGISQGLGNTPMLHLPDSSDHVSNISRSKPDYLNTNLPEAEKALVTEDRQQKIPVWDVIRPIRFIIELSK